MPRRLLLAAAFLLAATVVACTDRTPLAPSLGPTVRSAIDGRPLDAAVLARWRAVAQGCVFVATTEAGEPRVLALPRRFLPFRLPVARPGDAVARVVQVHTRDGRGGAVVHCAVPSAMSAPELAMLIGAHASHPQWNVVWSRLAHAAAYAESPISSEAREARFELGLGVAGSHSALALRFDITCPLYNPPSQGCTSLPGTTVSGSVDGFRPPGTDTYGGCDIDCYYERDQDPSSEYVYLDLGDDEPAECQWDCGEVEPPSEECLPEKDTACLKPLREKDRAAIDSAFSTLNDSLSAFCQAAVDLLRSKLATGQVMLGAAAAPSTADEGHHGFSSEGIIHIDEYYLDQVNAGNVKSHFLMELLIHEALHNIPDAENDGYPYWHPNDGSPKATYPYEGTKFYDILHGSGPCVRES